ncbi:DUF6584 family protein [Micromonospora sp. NPDC005979]|uniref:DUF6584 family protein n=1 Tax=Micromonospora sp. NPDC005979 TaxID=3156726 RepID=UPI0033A0E519
MAKEQVLAKVAADLERGHVHPAMQRLASLTAAYPDDLEVRARRAALYRQVGNVTEAGRWGFLDEDTDAREVTAFEGAYGNAWRRLRALRVTVDPSVRLGPVAGARFARLLEQAGRYGPVTWTDDGPRPEEPSSWRDGLGCLVAAVIALVLVALCVVGLVTVLRWVF